MGIPIFQISYDDKHICIYANGVVTGLDNCQVINRIPFAITREGMDEFSYKLPYAGLEKMSLLIGDSQAMPSHSARSSEQTCDATGEK